MSSRSLSALGSEDDEDDDEMPPRTPAAPAPTVQVSVFVELWLGLGILIALTIISKGLAPLVDLIFADLGIVTSLLVGFGLPIAIVVAIVSISYLATPSIRNNVSFGQYITKIISREQILIQIQSKDVEEEAGGTIGRIKVDSGPMYAPVRTSSETKTHTSPPPPPARGYSNII
jgi:hypothetical protein